MSSQVLSTQAVDHEQWTPWIRLLRAHAALTRELDARLEATHGISFRDYDVLVQLYYAPDNRMRRVDIAKSVLLSPSGITRLLEGLERVGWVAKHHCESDARVTWAVLTEEGKAKFEQAQKSHSADIEELFASNFDESERQQLANLLGRLPMADAGACNA